jgi:type II secretory pathway pseudopilin PulG
MRWLRERLLDERGMALIMAIGIMAVLATAGTTAIVYSTSDATEANQSRAGQNTFALAEAGLADAFAVLNLPTNNALDPDTLPACTSNQKKYTDPTATRTSTTTWFHTVVDGGNVDYCGTLVRSQALWYVASIGSGRNPNRASGTVTRTLEATVTVTPTITQPLNNPAWDYMFSTHTGSACDQTLNNNVGGGSWMYVAGNLCLNNNVTVTSSKVIVNGNVDISNNGSIGTGPLARVESYVGGNCRYGGGSWVACSGNRDPQHIFSSLPGGGNGVTHTPIPVVAAPTADFPGWYDRAIPGPSQSCTSSSGTPPVFDNNSSRDNSVSTPFDLTPASSYSCRVGPGASTTLSTAITSSQTSITVASAAGFPTTQFQLRIDDEVLTVTGGFGTTTWTVARGANSTTAAAHVASQTAEWNTPASGELGWNATTKTLSVSGTIYIDGSAKVGNGTLDTYNGQATVYLSGTMYFNGSLCGGISGGNCNFASWDPNKELLTFVAGGTGGQVSTNDSVQLANNTAFQGGLFATGNVEYGNNAYSDGPVVGGTIILSNNVTTNAFPNITTVPVGMPSNPVVYAQPNPPQAYSG